MPTVYRYQCTFRHKKTKVEFIEFTQAYSVMDAVIQCILTASSRGVDNNEYDLTSVGPHPDEMVELSRDIATTVERLLRRKDKVKEKS